jgi:type IV pilus assembly protein PilW
MRASARPQPGKVQLQASLLSAAAFDDGVVPPGYDAASETRDLVVHAYYVDNTSSFADGIPSLRRQTLVDGGVIEDQEMVSGVENLQIQLGLDTNGDGSVERYVDPDSPTVTEGAVGYLPGARVVAVRLWMLVRSEESPAPAWRDEREYRPLDLDDPPILPGDDLYPSQFQRLEVTKTVFLRNQTGTS